MILIVSNHSDHSTNAVIKWLNAFNQEWVRINEDTPITFQSVHIGKNHKPVFKFTYGSGLKVIETSKLKSYWYRRSDFILKQLYELEHFNELELEKQIKKHCQSELQYLLQGMHAILAKTDGINDRRFSDLNKYDVLLKAEAYGLRIPETLITTSKEDYLNFKAKHNSVISKAIQNGMRMSIKAKENAFTYQCYTELFDQPEEIPETFFPTLFQENVAKKYELRIFFLKGKFYPMVIFSQIDQHTETDFRNYNFDHPNRTMRYALPHKIETQLLHLMEDLNLNSGSIDLIYGKDQTYYFLEVNPVGQFGMVSTPCNYGLEKIIAENLAHNE